MATGDIVLTEHHVNQPLSADLARLRREFNFPGDDALVVRCTLAWGPVVGAISLEVFGQYGADTFTDPATLFDAQPACWSTSSPARQRTRTRSSQCGPARDILDRVIGHPSRTETTMTGGAR